MVVYCLVYIIVGILCVLLSYYVYLFHYGCIVAILRVIIVLYVYAVVTLVAGLLARSQYSKGPATGHLDTGFSWFPVSISKC
jgi:hypothetical protein